MSIFGVLNMLVSVFRAQALLLVDPSRTPIIVAPVFVGGAVACLLAWVGGRGSRGHLRAEAVPGV